MKAKKTTAKRVGAKRYLPHKTMKRPARKVVIDKNVGTTTDGIVNLFALMQYQGKGEVASPLCFLQAARTGVVISCQT